MIAQPDIAIAAQSAGRRYGGMWALRGCTLALPAGSITALVGPNGAGKTTLLNMLGGLLPVSEGRLLVDGSAPSSRPGFLARIGFLAQDCPLYRSWTVADLVRFGRAMNPCWDDDLAHERIAAAEVPLTRRAGRLSGGQRAQVALALAIAKRPSVLLLDEPLAALDPLARRAFLAALLGSAGATGMSVILSSHLVADLARVCDHLVVIRDGQVRLHGELDELLSEHRRLAGPRDAAARLPDGVQVLSRSDHERHSSLIVRTRGPVLNPAFTSSAIDLEELVLTYLVRPAGQPGPRPVAVARSGHPR